jgi:hypothetical protein
LGDLALLGVALAGLACPAHMLWRMRRGHRGCIGAAKSAPRASDLRRRQRNLDRQLAELRDIQSRRPRTPGRGPG